MTAPPIQILLVEDDAAIRESLAECLELEGLGVRAAANGREALSWLGEGHRPRVVVLDLVMPYMGGDEVLARLRATPATKDLPVVLMTGASPGTTRMPAAERILAKPFELADLLDAVRPFL